MTGAVSEAKAAELAKLQADYEATKAKLEKAGDSAKVGIKFRKVSIAAKGDAINADRFEKLEEEYVSAREQMIAASDYESSGHEALAGAERDLASHEADSGRKRIQDRLMEQLREAEKERMMPLRPSPTSRNCRFCRRRSTANSRKSFPRAFSSVEGAEGVYNT